MSEAQARTRKTASTSAAAKSSTSRQTKRPEPVPAEDQLETTPAEEQLEPVSADEFFGDLPLDPPDSPLELVDEAVAQYGGVAARLLLAGESGPFTLVVTSAVSGEGVSTVSIGLAVALAASTTKSVVLLDANLRRPALHDMLGLPFEPGLHQVVSDQHVRKGRTPDSSKLFGALGRDALGTSVPNIWFVPAGAHMSNPAQLTTSAASRIAINSLHERFDFVIVDCPPVLTAVDAASICRLAGGVVLVVRAGITPREHVKRAQELLRGEPVMGVVLNGV
jgi:polysaccharide biosynthesis transport protein